MGYRAHQKRDESQRAEYWKAVYEFYNHGAIPASFVFLDETAKVDSALRRTKDRGDEENQLKEYSTWRIGPFISRCKCHKAF